MKVIKFLSAVWLVLWPLAAVAGDEPVAEIISVSDGCIVVTRASLDAPKRKLVWSGKSIPLTPGEFIKCKNSGQLVLLTRGKKVTVGTDEWYPVSAVQSLADAVSTRSETDIVRTGSRGSGQPIPPNVLKDEGFDPSQSVGVFVGIRTYDDGDFAEVAYAVDDAIDLAHVFSIELGLITPDRLTVSISGEPQKAASEAKLQKLKDSGASIESPTRPRILSSIRQRAREAGPGGLVIVSLATHGFTKDGRDLLVAVDSYRDVIEETGIDLPKILSMVNEATSARRVVLLDACRETLSQKKRAAGADPSSAMGTMFHDAITGAAGQVVLSAATQGGYAYDDDEAQNGVFTSAILEGLNGAAEGDAKGFITVSSLADYVSRSVQDWVRLHRPEAAAESRGITTHLEGTMAAMPFAMKRDSHLVSEAIGDLESSADQKLQADAVARLQRQAADEPSAKLWLAYARYVGLGGLDIDKEEARRLGAEAFDEVRKQANAGNIESLCALGHAYSLGLGTPSDPTEAIKHYQRAAESASSANPKHSAYAMYRLGEIYDQSSDPHIVSRSKALRWYEKAAKAGQPDAAFKFALAYWSGNGVKKDPTEETRWYRVAALGGHPTAMFSLAKCYSDGRGVPQDYEEARTWYKRAAEAGHVPSMINLGWLYNFGKGVDRDFAVAADWYRRAAEGGSELAMFNLALSYKKGEGVEQNAKKAVKWFRAASEGHHVKATYMLGVMYKDGEGIEKDLAQAVHYYRLAAQMGHVASLYDLAQHYESGSGVEKDDVAAAALYSLAAVSDYQPAMINLGILYREGRGVKEDDKMALGLFKSASEGTNASSNAHFYLGLMYNKGEGTRRDAGEAVAHYRKAADLGSVSAMNNLAVLYENGTDGIAKDESLARFYYERSANKGNTKAMYNLGLLFERSDDPADLERARDWYGKAASEGHEAAKKKLAALDVNR